MMDNSMGIILRRTGGSVYKFSLLDKIHGRIECIVARSELCVGSFISYALYDHRNAFFLKDIEGIHTPLILGSIDLLFLHHVLELLYYFAPVGSCVMGIFDLLAFLYAIEHILLSKKFKKFFLLKLLTLLGITPEVEAMRFPVVADLCSLTIDLFDDNRVSDDDEKKLDRWLWYCVWQHPYVNEFKTVHFLEKNRMI